MITLEIILAVVAYLVVGWCVAGVIVRMWGYDGAAFAVIIIWPVVAPVFVFLLASEGMLKDGLRGVFKCWERKDNE